MGDEGKYIKNLKATFKINGKTYNTYCNKYGFAYIKLNLPSKKYSIVSICGGAQVTNSVIVKNVIVAKNINLKKNSKVINLKISLKKVNGKYLRGKITLKFNGKYYKTVVNKQGVAIFKINKNIIKKLKVGKKYFYKSVYLKDYVTKYIKLK